MQVRRSKCLPQEKDGIMKKNDKRIFFFSVVLSALILAVLCGLPAAAQQTPAQPQVLRNAVSNQAIHFDVSPPLGERLAQVPAAGGVRTMHAPRQPKMQQLASAKQSVGGRSGSALR